MLILKAERKLLLFVTILLMMVYSFNNVFLSIILGKVIEAATASSITHFVQYALTGFVGFLGFMLVGVIMVQCKSRIIMQLNRSIKESLIRGLINNQDILNGYSDDLSLMTNELKQLETKGIEAEFTLLSLLFTFVFAVLTSFRYDIWIALAFFVGSLIPVVISLLFKEKITYKSKKWINANMIYTNKLKDYLDGVETIKTYQAEDEFILKTTESANEMEESLRVMNATVETVNQFIYMGVMMFSLLIPFGIGVFRVINHGVLLASFIAIVQLSNSLRNPAIQIMQQLNGYATVTDIKKKYSQMKINTRINPQIQEEFKSLRIENFSFSFKDKVVFKGSNLAINSNDKILITGQSGVGKSTLLRIIQRVLIPQGKYYFNEKEEVVISEVFSLIRQQPLMFNDSIKYNITLGKNYTDDELESAISLAKLDDVIYEKGLDYIVGENGKNLSVGQIQRIEIARALIRKRPIILADEITSSIDAKTASEIRMNILKLPCTLVEVSHNTSDKELSLYNRIWNIENNDIVEQNTK